MFGKRKLLVVDDESEVTEAIVKALTLEGYDVTGTTNPVEALEMIKKGNFMIVISDIQMPEMRGTELLKEIKSYNGMIQVIIITGFVTIDNILTCLELGANDCFFKPIKMKGELLKAVKAAVAKLERWEQVINELVMKKP